MCYPIIIISSKILAAIKEKSLDIGLCRWIPDDIEDFAAKYGAEFDEVVSKKDFGCDKRKIG